MVLKLFLRTHTRSKVKQAVWLQLSGRSICWKLGLSFVFCVAWGRTEFSKLQWPHKFHWRDEAAVPTFLSFYILTLSERWQINAQQHLASQSILLFVSFYSHFYSLPTFSKRNCYWNVSCITQIMPNVDISILIMTFSRWRSWWGFLFLFAHSPLSQWITYSLSSVKFNQDLSLLQEVAHSDHYSKHKGFTWPFIVVPYDTLIPVPH